MNSKSIFFICLTVLVGCGQNQTERNTENTTVGSQQEIATRVVAAPIQQGESIIEKVVQEDSKFGKNFLNKVLEILGTNQFVPFEALQSQKLRNIEEVATVKLATAPASKMTGNDIYFYLKDRTLVIGSPVFNDQIKETVLIGASAFVVHEDGVIVTNYHVIDRIEGQEVKGIFAADKDGEVYNVTEVLTCSQENDLAILKIDTKGKKLKSITLAEQELMGEDMYMMGHPFNNHYFMSRGIVSRKYRSNRDDAVKIAVTSEFGQGASGGPMVNQSGQLIGMVSGTMMEYTNGSRQHGDLQMVIKEAIPVSVIWDYVKR